MNVVDEENSTLEQYYLDFEVWSKGSNNKRPIFWKSTILEDPLDLLVDLLLFYVRPSKSKDRGEEDLGDWRTKWFRRGFDGFSKNEEEEEERARRDQGLLRDWLN
jgi:hypothetical protein